MKSLFKYSSQLFLFLAGAIILLHSIVPHHHHIAENQAEKCEHQCELTHETHNEWHCEHEHENCSDCVFPKTLTTNFSKLSLELPFFVNDILTPRIVLTEISIKEFQLTKYYSYLFSSPKSSRAPPVA